MHIFWWLLLAALAWLIWRIRARSVDGVPTPITFWPLLGHLPQFWWNSDRVFDFLHDLAVVHAPKTSYLSVPTVTPFFLIVSPEATEYVLKTNFPNYEKTFLVERFGEVLGNGIFGSDGPKWIEQRKSASRIFSLNALKDMFSVFEEHSRSLLGVIRTEMRKNGQIEMQNVFQRFTFDSFCHIAFGAFDVKTLENGTHPFAEALDEAQRICSWRLIQPWFFIWRFFNVFSEKRLRQCIAELDKFVQQVYDQYNALDSRQRESRTDVIAMSYAEAQKQGKTLSPKEFRDIVVNLIIAGRDTTATAMSWALWELQQHPDIASQVIAEIDRVCGPPSDEHGLDFDKVYRELNITHAFLAETLRLHPSVPADTKTCLNDDRLPDGTFIPAGSQIAYLPYHHGRNPHIWTDPEKFDLSRWFGEEPSQWRWPTFNAGPRLCLGKQMAFLEMKTVFVNLLQRYQVPQLAAGAPAVRYVFNITLQMRDGIHVVFRERTDRR
eukprot:gnl/Spiro4/6513_TR3340_c0_g1_i1.p1 gnl/Spiro4/6513_TR3340_c0_g1~~gnl/Spiro4/6513_TR3340_c0_g1_i1.p1  ORF type:complete len:519 (-),score=130.21 gnl/Spiro4/6513_TR3340_c0_g1_i1:77-1555(-)